MEVTEYHRKVAAQLCSNAIWVVVISKRENAGLAVMAAQAVTVVGQLRIA
jgi:hypothetical protein